MDSAGTTAFKAKLLRPALPKSATWTFVLIPAKVSAQLPTRAQTSVDGKLAGSPFHATLEPDGQGSHWLKVPKALRESAGVQAGDVVAIELAPSTRTREPTAPADLRKALAADDVALARWKSLTAVARRDWIQWITSAKKAETRERRIDSAREMLASGKRRVCCFDRSGIYIKGFAAPIAAE